MSMIGGNGNGNGSGDPTKRSAFAGAGLGAGAATLDESATLNHTVIEDAIDDELDEDTAPPQKEKQVGRRKNWTLVVVSVLVVGLMTVGVIVWWLSQDGGKKQIQARAQDPSRAAAPSAAATDSQLTQSAIEQARTQVPVGPQPGASPLPTGPQIVVQPGGVASAGTSPVVVTPGVAGTVGTEQQSSVRPAPGAREYPSSGAGTAAAPSTSVARGDDQGDESEPNPQRSFAFGEEPSARAASSSPASAPGSNLLAGMGFPNVMVGASAGNRAGVVSVARPPFGAMIPLRTLGAIYSLRTGALVRLATTRAVKGDGWTLANRTVFVGTVRRADADRITVSVIGFIDPRSGLLVRVGGDVYDSDGGAGVQGKRRRLDSRWLSWLGRGVNTGIRLLEEGIRGRNGTTVILPNAQGVYQPEIATLNGSGERREFIEVQAGKNCYVMITDLPREIEGVDALEQMSGEQLASALDVNGDTSTGLSDADLASLISTGSADDIRAALPQMKPQMRRLAEAYLRYANK